MAMNKAGLQLSNELIKLVAPGAGSNQLVFTAARVTEELSKLTEMTIEFISTTTALEIEDLLGTRMTLEVGLGLPGTDGTYSEFRKITGTCISIERLGIAQGYPMYTAEVRPWPWFLTKMSGDKIHAEMKAPDIIKAVCRDAGFSDFTDRMSGTYRKRVYTVQYGETHFDFISRLMEEEGIYYYFDHSGTVEKLVFADSPGSHDPTPYKSSFTFDPRTDGSAHDEDELYDWAEKRSIATGKVMLVDYNFENPNADMKPMVAIPKGNHSHKTYQKYEMGAHFTTAEEGTHYSQVRADREAHAAERYFGTGNARNLQCGASVNLEGHPRTPNLNSLILGTTYHFRIEREEEKKHSTENLGNSSRLTFPDMKGPSHVEFKTAPFNAPYRPPVVTPRPSLTGLYVGIVDGPDGEEIHTDSYGRIRCRFPWMMSDDTSQSCWVRVAMMWAGTSYGMFSVPRIGDEVIIAFEGGDPSRPVCTGMLYNYVNQHPLPMPGQMTKSGIRTKSTKQGARDAYHELSFDDLKGEELINFQSEKNYTQIVKNNATITVGMEKADPGDLHQTIKNSKTEIIKDGDYTQTVETGSRILKVKTDHTDTVEGKSTTTITGDTAVTIKTGNKTETVKTGNLTQTVSKGHVTRKIDTGNVKTTIAKGHNALTVKTGNDVTTVNTGNFTVNVAKGQVNISAKTKLTLKVGGSKITITPTSIELKSTQIKLNGTKVDIKGSALTNVEGKITNVKASGILTVKGSLTKIN